MGTLRPFLVLSTGHGIGIASHLFNRKNGHQERSIQGPPLLLRPLVWTEVDWTSKKSSSNILVAQNMEQTMAICLTRLKKGRVKRQRNEELRSPADSRSFLLRPDASTCSKTFGIGTMMGMMRVETCAMQSHVVY